MKTAKVLAALILASTTALAQTPPWTVVVTESMNPLPIGMCGAVHLSVIDPATREVPRNPKGYRISIADFDMTVSSGAAGQYNGAALFVACGCPGAAVGTTVTVTATYPAQFLPAGNRVPGVSIQQSSTFTLAPPKGPTIPTACQSLAAAAPSPVSGAAAVGTAGWSSGVPISNAGARTPTSAPVSAPAAATGGAQAGTTAPNIGQPVPIEANPTMRAPGGGTPAGAVSTAPPPPPAAPTPAPAPVLVPVNPSGFRAIQGAPGEVVLGWNPVGNAAFYVIFGPGLEPGGQRVEQGAGALFANALGTNQIMVGATNVPNGAQEWAVASYYENNLSTPAAQFPRVSLNVQGVQPAAPTPAANTPATSTPAPTSQPPATAPAASGKYLVTITGIRAYQASADDMLSRDGVGDEIYAAAYIRRYDRATGALLETSTKKSMPHGDVTHFASQRLQAGTRSQTGGIRDGDMIPDGPLVATRSVLPQTVTFPMRLWEGTLTDGVEALVISPSLWEQDVGEQFYNQWLQFEHSINVSLFAKSALQDQITQKRFDDVVFGMSGNDVNSGGASLAHMAIDAGMMLGGAGVPIIGLITTTADRPLGLVQNGRDVTALPNHTVVLTREIIETALSKPPIGTIPSPVANGPSFGGLLGALGASTPPIARIGVIAPKPGIIVIQLQDRDNHGTLALPERPAIYQMFIQVERVP